jgi:hypothetical protein
MTANAPKMTIPPYDVDPLLSEHVLAIRSRFGCSRYWRVFRVMSGCPKERLG